MRRKVGRRCRMSPTRADGSLALAKQRRSRRRVGSTRSSFPCRRHLPRPESSHDFLPNDRMPFNFVLDDRRQVEPATRFIRRVAAQAELADQQPLRFRANGPTRPRRDQHQREPEAKSPHEVQSSEFVLKSSHRVPLEGAISDPLAGGGWQQSPLRNCTRTTQAPIDAALLSQQLDTVECV